MKHLVTGATGNVGALVVEGLIARGERPRVFARDAAKARARFGDRVEVAVGDLADAGSMAAALSGVDTLFLVTMGHDLHERDELAANAAKAARVRRLVKLSTIDAEHEVVGTGVWHARGEAAIRASGVPFVFVRPSGFMVNALYWAHSIKSEGVVRSATGDGKIPFIHSKDIADVSIRALTEKGFEGEALPITGPEALSYADMTRMIGAAIGKPLRWEAVSDEAARKQQEAWGALESLIEARLSIFRAIRDGRLATVTDTAPRLLCRNAFTFAQWAGENADAFR